MAPVDSARRCEIPCTDGDADLDRPRSRRIKNAGQPLGVARHSFLSVVFFSASSMPSSIRGHPIVEVDGRNWISRQCDRNQELPSTTRFRRQIAIPSPNVLCLQHDRFKVELNSVQRSSSGRTDFGAGDFSVEMTVRFDQVGTSPVLVKKPRAGWSASTLKLGCVVAARDPPSW